MLSMWWRGLVNLGTMSVLPIYTFFGKVCNRPRKRPPR
jgi:hypothetical protein